MLIPGKTKCISNVGVYYFPHFIIIQAFALHHTYIDFCKYCDIQKVVMKSPQRPPLATIYDILSIYVYLIEVWPLCRSCNFYIQF